MLAVFERFLYKTPPLGETPEFQLLGGNLDRKIGLYLPDTFLIAKRAFFFFACPRCVAFGRGQIFVGLGKLIAQGRRFPQQPQHQLPRCFERPLTVPQIGLQRVPLLSLRLQPILGSRAFPLERGNHFSMSGKLGRFPLMPGFQILLFGVAGGQTLIDPADLLGLKLQAASRPLGFEIQFSNAAASRSQF